MSSRNLYLQQPGPNRQNFTWPNKIMLTSSHFKRPGSKICLQNPTLWHFSVFIISLWECWTHWTMWKGEKHFSSQSQSAAVRRLSGSILAWGQDNRLRPRPRLYHSLRVNLTGCILTGSGWGAQRCTQLSWSIGLQSRRKLAAENMYLILHNT